MADLMLLAVVIGLLGAWMSGRAAIYELLCQHILRRAPRGGAAVALATLMYFGTYFLVLGVLWWLFVTHKLFDHARIAF